MDVDAESDSGELGKLFTEITGETTVTESRRRDEHPPDGATDGLDDYERRHDELARHEALDDALEEPDTE